MDINHTEIDDTWIKKFKEVDKLYADFYKEDVYYINTRFVYINKQNEIIKVKQNQHLMNKKNIVSRDELIGILKRNSNECSTDYSLLYILKYNITFDTEDVIYNTTNNDFLMHIKNIDDIVFDKTINTFQDLNDLIFVFYEKSNKENKNNCTKKVYLNSHSNHKKTIRR